MHSTIGIKVLLSAAMALCAAAWAADNVAPLDVKPGQWETTVTIARNGAPPIPPDVLAKMSPEQRAMIEARMKAGMNLGPQTHVAKHCVTREDMARAFAPNEDKQSCTRTVLSSTSSSQDFRVDCASSGMTAIGHIEAVDSEHLRGKVKSTTTQSGQTTTSETTIFSKWLGAACPEKKQQ